MKRFFFYGTLLDPDVVAVVLGRRLPPVAFAPAFLPRHKRRRAEGKSYPIVVRAPSGGVAGAIVGGLSEKDVARLAAYEGPSYRVVTVGVAAAGGRRLVSMFESLVHHLPPTSEAWELVLWQRCHKRAFIDRLRRSRQ